MITNTDEINPWVALPQNPPYILPADTDVLLQQTSKKQGLRFDVLPDPYIGNLREAKVIFLALNPGFRQADIDENMINATFIANSRANMLHKSEPPFYYFNEELAFTGGNEWWSRILKPLISAGLTKQTLSSAIMCIQYLSYHSVTYSHLNKLLPSQQYSFELVREAVELNKTIVIMRSEALWLKAVPELQGYPYIRIKNPRNPVVSVANLGQDNFDKICRAIS